MRKSFEKYLRGNSTLNHKNSKNQGGGVKLYKLKYYVIGFIIGLFFVGSLSYASTNKGTIGMLFGLKTSTESNGSTTSNYRLDGENIKDFSITSSELRKNSVIEDKIAKNSIITDKIKDKQVTKSKLSFGAVDGDIIKANSISTRHIRPWQVTNDKLGPNSVDTSKIKDNSIEGKDIQKDTITEREIDDNYKPEWSKNSKNANALNGRMHTTHLTDTDDAIPTSKAVKDYVDNHSSSDIEAYFNRTRQKRNNPIKNQTYYNEKNYPIELSVSSGPNGHYNFCHLSIYVGGIPIHISENNNDNLAKVCGGTVTIPPKTEYKVVVDGYRGGGIQNWSELK